MQLLEPFSRRSCGQRGEFGGEETDDRRGPQVVEDRVSWARVLVNDEAGPRYSDTSKTMRKRMTGCAVEFQAGPTL